MPLRYDILQDQGLVCAASAGPLSVAELVGHVEDLVADTRYRPPMKSVLDLRASEPTALGSPAYRMFAAAKLRHAERFGGETCALVAASDLDYGLCRLHVAHLGALGRGVEVFRELDAALEWLGVPSVAEIEAVLEPLANVS